jgi:hypothetical protein
MRPKIISVQLLYAIPFLFVIEGCRGDAINPQKTKVVQLASIKGANLAQYTLQDGNKIYVQVITLSNIKMDQLIGDQDSVKPTQGYYYPGKKDAISPYFRRVSAAAIQTSYQQQYGSKVFSMINASFFEDYQKSTRLSFPIKLNGTIITAGSSPYGPIAKPKDPYYKTIQLRALMWNEKTVVIVPYDSKTGAPLNQSGLRNAIVSYAYRDHPAVTLAGDPPNRYHVLGVKDSDVSQAGAEQLLIATANRTTLEKAAQVLRQQGVTGDMMTVDGGISTYLYSPKVGNIVLPQAASGEKEAALPHYLGFRAKNEQ